MACSPCAARRAARKAAQAPSVPVIELWSVQWPSGETAAFASEGDARAFYDNHEARAILTLLAPTE